MSESENKVPAGEMPPEGEPQHDMESLLMELDCDKVLTCQKARRKLVLRGRQALPYLARALSSKRVWVRWEAAKALSEIADPQSTDLLIKLLQSPEFELHWLAAEGLIRIGRPALIPLLEALIKRSESLWLRLGAHRILHDMDLGELISIIRPVRVKLEDTEPQLEVPAAARAALNKLRQRTSAA